MPQIQKANEQLTVAIENLNDAQKGELDNFELVKQDSSEGSSSEEDSSDSDAVAPEPNKPLVKDDKKPKTDKAKQETSSNVNADQKPVIEFDLSLFKYNDPAESSEIEPETKKTKLVEEHNID